MFDHKAKVLSRAYWQYKNAPKLLQWLLLLPDIVQARIEDQLEKIQRILNIDTAEGEQLDICGRIAGFRTRPAGRFYPSCEVSDVDDVLFRKMIKAKVCKNNGIATLDDVKAAADYILGVETVALDGQDMTMRVAWQSDAVSVAVQQLVADYDLIPRPQGVGMRKHRVVKYKPFGFGAHNTNFNRAPFWYGDGIPPIHYYGQITLYWDGKGLNGQVVVNDLSVDDLDVTLALTDADGGVTNRYVVTDTGGAFSADNINGPVTVLAKTVIITTLCETLELESDPFNIPA